MKRRLIFKVGQKYVLKTDRNRKHPRVWTCSVDSHPWDRTKRLTYKLKCGMTVGIHISELNREDFIVLR